MWHSAIQTTYNLAIGSTDAARRAPDEQLAWLALCLTPGIGGAMLTRLLNAFASAKAALAASPEDLQTVPGIGPGRAARILNARPDALIAALAAWQEAGITAHTWDAPDYPANLRAIGPDAPPLLFARGAVVPGDARAVAIVGTRHPSAVGARAAHKLGYELAARGLTVVSGLALGIDGAAHQGALDAGGRTLAVLGSGLAHISPRQHTRLAAAISASGALLSELHPHTLPSAPSLVARNRIISGLSRAVIVVEAGAESGSLHAARRARAQNRLVCVVAGSGEGVRQLAREGALMIDMQALSWDDLATRIDDKIVSAQQHGQEVSARFRACQPGFQL